MTNRGRHKKPDINKYPIECKDLRDFNTFRKAFTIAQANSLISNIRVFSSGKCDLALWEKSPTSSANGRGFLWSLSSQGHVYWKILINHYSQLKNKSK